MGVMRLVAYDEADINGTALGELTEAMEKHIDAEYNGAGGGDFQISRHSFTQAPWCRPGRYIRVWLDTISGDPVHSFFVNQSFDEVLGEDEDGIEVYRRQGNGPLYYLSDAMVPETSFTNADSAAPAAGDGADQWVWPAGVHPAGVMVRMLEEAQAQGQLPDLTWDFSRTVDSDGTPWSTTVGEEFTLTIGQNLMEVVAVTQSIGVVYQMSHDFVLHAFDAPDNIPTGRNLSASVVFTKGVDIAASAERQQLESTARSTMVVKGQRTDNGELVFVRVDSAAGLAETIRPKIGFFDYGRTADFDTLQQAGLTEIYRKLRLKAGPTAISLDESRNAGGKRAFIDYVPGDQVTVDIPGTFNAVVKPITSIQLTETEAGEYDVVVGFDEDPARIEGPVEIANGPAGVPDTGCCPDEGPFVPPPVDEDCGIAATATLHIGSHAFFGEPDPPDHNFAYSSEAGTTVTLTSGFQYRMVVDVVYNNPTTGSDNTLTGGLGVDLLYPTGGTPANPPGPNGAEVDAPTYGWSIGGVADDGLGTGDNGLMTSYGTGANFTSPWKRFDGPDVVCDIVMSGVPSSGFHGFETIATIRVDIRNGDGTAIDCGDDTVQTAPHEGQTAIEQAAGSGTSRVTNFPYIPGSLVVFVGGVLVQVTETDPTTGEFELPFDPGSSPVIVFYQGTSDPTPTGAGNGSVAPGTYPIPTNVLPDTTVVPFEHGSMGATETIDAGDSLWHRGTLSADVAITVSGFTADEAQTLIVGLTQDGTGGHAITWDSDVVFAGDDQPGQAAGEVTWYILWSDEGDSTIYGAIIGGGTSIASLDDIPDVNAPTPSNGDVLTWDSTPGEWVALPASTVAGLDDLTDVVITTPAADDTLRYISGVWVNDPRQWEAVTNGEDVFVWEGADLVHEWSTP